MNLQQADVSLAGPVSELQQILGRAAARLQADASEAVCHDVQVELSASLRQLIEGQGLEACRAAFPAVWQHPLLRRLHENPGIEHSFARPRGYPGDAELLDYIYGVGETPRRLGEASALGQTLYKLQFELQASRAVRARAEMLGERITALMARRPGARVLSLACGHLEEARWIDWSAGELGLLLGLDQDPRSVAEASARFPQPAVSSRQASVRQVLRGRMAERDFDLAYASGLYDYLELPVAKRLTQVLFERLAVGGSLIIPNFVPMCSDIGFMELAMRWSLIYRDEQQLAEIVYGALPADSVRVKLWRGPAEQIAYAEVTRLA